MKHFIALALGAIFLSACSSAPAPTDSRVQQIKTACAIDAGIRPGVQALEVFATPAERAGLTAARAVIDGVCANPAAPLDQQAVTAFSSAAGNVVTLYAQLQGRQHAQQ